jgi:Ca2+-binding RTX toxin-like protein
VRGYLTPLRSGGSRQKLRSCRIELTVWTFVRLLIQGSDKRVDETVMQLASVRIPLPAGAIAGWVVLLLLIPLTGDAAAATCAGKHATIVGTPGNDVIVGKKASDVIYGGGGDDQISGGPNGNDTICGGPGNDSIHGGRGFDSLYGEEGDDRLAGDTGSDQIDGGGGNDSLSGAQGSDSLVGGSGDDELLGAKGPDHLVGGAGDDFLVGDKGNDDADGGSGNDRISGDKGNDRLDGGQGNDQIDGGPGDDPNLEGGPGTDVVFGGAGSDSASGGEGDGDVVRGDSGEDTLDGGPGSQDIVSYASATRSGVVVDLASSRSKGDGHDTLQNFEDVVGSPQGDDIVGDGSVNRLDGGVGNDSLDGAGGPDEAFGGAGSDGCAEFAVEHSCGEEPSPPESGTYAILNQGLDGTSLVVQGDANPNHIHVSFDGSGWTVSDSGTVVPGDGCALSAGSNTIATCPVATATGLVVITGGAGNDSIEIDAGVPAGVKVRANGNAGSDSLSGGPGDDVLEAGENYNNPDDGNDTLIGNGGSDVLYADPGADQLSGGPGNDLLVSSVKTCQGHSYDGGPGDDTVSYGRSDAALKVELGGSGGPAGCNTPDQVGASNESLEGSDGPDVLIGDSGENSFLGHLGADTFIGKGGGDFIDAVDGRPDKLIQCGGGDDSVVKDPADPQPVDC